VLDVVCMRGRYRSMLLALALASLAAACGNNSAPTSPSTTGPTTELFSGSLSVQSSSFYSFNATQAGTVNLMLASVTSPGGRATSPVILGLAFGIPMGTGCTHDQSLETAAGLNPQISAGTTSGVHCVDVYDVGNLTGPVSFTVRIVHP
jgi:hypothetical protein